MTKCIVIIFIVVLCIYLFPVMNSELGKETRCLHLEIVKYKVIGQGGLFGSVTKVETISDDFDGYMNKCISWKGALWGEYSEGEEIK